MQIGGVGGGGVDLLAAAEPVQQLVIRGLSWE